MKLNNIVNLKTVGYPFNSLDIKQKDTNSFIYEELSMDNNHNNLLLIIDPQNDFMEDGPLAVKGARKDMLNLINFIHNNLDKIDKIKVSLDSHNYKQIFSQSWWVDEDNNHPDFFTNITKDSDFKPLFHKDHSEEYLDYLEKTDKELIIWPYHCILGTYGHNIEPNLENMLSYFSLVTKKKVDKIVKGLNPLSEMYGIFKEEYCPNDKNISPILAKSYGKYKNIIIAGEAKSHCVLESVKQMCELYKYDSFNSNIYILEDCMSSIEGFETKTEEMFKLLASKYNLILTTSKKISL